MITNLFTKAKNTEMYYLYVYFYFFMMPWNLFNSQMGILTLMLLIFWIARFKYILKKNILKIFLFKPILFFIMFLIFAYLSSFWSESIIDGFKNINKYYKYFIIIIPILLTSLSLKEAKNSIVSLTLSFVTYSVFSLMIYFGLFEIVSNGSNSSNPKGIFGFSTSTQYMSFGALISFILTFFTNSKKLKALFFIVSIMCIFTVFINNSRTSQLSLLLSFFVIITFYFFKSKSLKNSLKGLTLIVIFLFSFIFFLESTNKLNKFKYAINEVNTLISTNEYGGSFGVRLFMNKVGIETLIEHPLLGVGPVDNNKILEQRMKEDPNYKGPIIDLYHSFHMDTLTKYGLIGYSLLSLSIIFLLIFLKEDKKNFYIGLSIFSFLFFVSLANATLDKKPINYIYISFFILLSIIAFYNKLRQEKINNA